MALLASTSVTTPRALGTCLSASSHLWRKWSSTWSARACSIPRSPRHSTAGWTTRKPSAARRWCCATTTRRRRATKNKPKATSPGCAQNLSRSSASTCLSTVRTTGWSRKSVQNIAPKFPTTCRQGKQIRTMKGNIFIKSTKECSWRLSKICLIKCCKIYVNVIFPVANRRTVADITLKGVKFSP